MGTADRICPEADIQTDIKIQGIPEGNRNWEVSILFSYSFGEVAIASISCIARVQLIQLFLSFTKGTLGALVV